MLWFRHAHCKYSNSRASAQCLYTSHGAIITSSAAAIIIVKYQIVVNNIKYHPCFIKCSLTNAMEFEVDS